MPVATPLALSSLNGVNGFSLNGVSNNDFSGISVASAGDINGDGIADLIIGANQVAVGFDNAVGASYVLFGHTGAFAGSIDLSGLTGTNGFRLIGTNPGDYFGYSVAGAGDVNGDGIADLLVGAYLGGSGAGSSYVVFGHTGTYGATFEVSTLNGSNGFRLDGGNTFDASGFSVASAGDVNGDGFSDLLIGARGADPNGHDDSGSTYVVFGHAGGFDSAINLFGLDGMVGFQINGVGGSDQSGISVASAGDVNGDGFADVIIGANLADPTGRTNGGAAYVVFGHAGGFASNLDATALDGTNGFRLDGAAANDETGFSVASAGDINGDGFGDLLIGAPQASPGGHSGAGSTYVVFGHAGGFASAINLGSLNGLDGFRIDGDFSGGEVGHSVSSAGDINADGFADLIIGDPFNRVDGTGGVGSSFVLLGHLGGFSANIVFPNVVVTDLNGSNGFRLDGVGGSDLSGDAVSSAGDINGDGLADLLVGALQADSNGKTDNGVSYVVFGSDAGANPLFRGTTLADQLRGTAGDDTIYALGGNDQIRGSGGNDLIDGGDGVDTAVFSGTQAQSRIGTRDAAVVVSGPDGVDQLQNVEMLKFGNAAAVSIATLQGMGGTEELSLLATGGANRYVLPDVYNGPVAFLQYQVLGSADGEIALGTSRNDFINTLGGDDAVDGGAGNDVIDGGTGSNFLTGGAGIDTFFLDGRGGNSTWSTITDWQVGEQLSVFGWKPGVSKVLWLPSDGTPGYKGVTMHADLDGNGLIDTSVTWTGKTQADLPVPFEFPDLLWFV